MHVMYKILIVSVIFTIACLFYLKNRDNYEPKNPYVAEWRKRMDREHEQRELNIDKNNDFNYSIKEEELFNVTSVVININGFLCARIIDINKLKIKNTYEITCIEYRGGSGQVRYIMDAGSGRAWKP